MLTINKPFNKLTDTIPYSSGISNRQQRRGNQKLEVNSLGQVALVRRVKSAKRKKDWI